MCVRGGGEEGRRELLSWQGDTKKVGLYFTLPLNPPSLAMAEMLSLARLLDTSCNESKIRSVVIRYCTISNFAAFKNSR